MRWLILIALVGCGGGKSNTKSPKDENVMPPSSDREAMERYNQAIPLRNKAAEAQHQGDWQAARAALQECVTTLNEPNCVRELKDLESQHRF